MGIKLYHCWCGMSLKTAGKMHYQANDPENGPAHPQHPGLQCKRCNQECPPDAVHKDGICYECLCPSPSESEYRVILAYHGRGGSIAFAHNTILAMDEQKALETAIASLQNTGYQVDKDSTLRRWYRRRKLTHHDSDLPAPVVYEIKRDEMGNEEPYALQEM